MSNIFDILKYDVTWLNVNKPFRSKVVIFIGSSHNTDFSFADKN
jgi:hypothetical protein